MTKHHLTLDNGYTVSVINDGYGSDRGLYEIAAFAPGGKLVEGPEYPPFLGDCVLGWLTMAEVETHIITIAGWPAVPTVRRVIPGEIEPLRDFPNPRKLFEIEE